MRVPAEQDRAVLKGRPYRLCHAVASQRRPTSAARHAPESLVGLKPDLRFLGAHSCSRSACNRKNPTYSFITSTATSLPSCKASKCSLARVMISPPQRLPKGWSVSSTSKGASTMARLLSSSIILLSFHCPQITGQFGFDFFYRRQTALQFLGQGAGELGFPFGDADRLGAAAEGVFHQHAVFFAHQQQAEGGFVVGMGQQAINGGHVHAELRCVAGLDIER